MICSLCNKELRDGEVAVMFEGNACHRDCVTSVKHEAKKLPYQMALGFLDEEVIDAMMNESDGLSTYVKQFDSPFTVIAFSEDSELALYGVPNEQRVIKAIKEDGTEGYSIEYIYENVDGKHILINWEVGVTLIRPGE